MATSVIERNAALVPAVAQAQPLQDMENNFLAAGTLSVFSGVSTRGSGMAWYGFKVTRDTQARAIVFRSASNGIMMIALATREADGTWTLAALQ